MTKPCALLTSCTNISPSELVKQILSINELPNPTTLLENIYSYPWHIETKYYSADVSLCTSDIRTIGNKSFADSVQAFVAMFDTTQQSSFDKVLMWLPYLKEIKPPIQILVCSRCSENDVVSRDVALSWCLDNEFELIELEPEVDNEDDSVEDDFKETVGVERVIEALSFHSWPNLVMKDKPNIGNSCTIEQLLSEMSSHNQADTNLADSAEDDGWTHFVESDTVVSLPQNVSAVQQQDKPNIGNNCTFEQLLSEMSSHNQADTNLADSADDDGWTHFVESDTVVSPPQNVSAVQQQDSGTKDSETNPSGQEAQSSTEIIDSMVSSVASNNVQCDDANREDAVDDESFDKLFDQLQIMKAAAVGLSTDQRKKYAEQVTMQFWKALGGNLEEFDGLSDSD